MYKWPIIDKELKLSVLNQLERSLSDVDSSGIIGEVELAIKEYYKSDHSIFFSCATGAMHTLYYALDLKPGDNIIVPTYTFFATFSPFSYEGVEVRQVDTDKYGNINPDGIEELIDENTKFVVVTHMWGIPADLDKITEICNINNLLLVEDCSHAHLATYKGRKVGTIGDVGIFSTNQKTLTSGEGGFLITNDLDIFERSMSVAHYNKRIRNEVSTPALKEIQLTGLGLKYRGFTIGAAILKDQIKKIESIKKQRSLNYSTLWNAVEKSTLFNNISPPYNWESGLYVFPMLIKDPSTRPNLLQECHDFGFKYFDAPGSTKPLYNEPLFNGRKDIFHRLQPQKVSSSFLESEKFHRSIIKLPLWGDGEGLQPENEVVEYANFIKGL